MSWLTNPGGSGVYDNTDKYRFSQTLTTINDTYQSTAPYTDFQTKGRNVPAQNSTWNVGSGGNVYPFEATFTGTLYANVPSGEGINVDSAGTYSETSYFPEPGPYPFELDNTENSAPPYAIIFADSSGNPIDNS